MKYGCLIAHRFKVGKKVHSFGERTFFEGVDKIGNKKVLLAVYDDLPIHLQEKLISKEFKYLEKITLPSTLKPYEKVITEDRIIAVFQREEGLRPIGRSLKKVPLHYKTRIIEELLSIYIVLNARGMSPGVVLPDHLAIDENGKLLLLDISRLVRLNNPKTKYELPLPDSICVAPELYKSNAYSTASDVYNVGTLMMLILAYTNQRDLVFNNKNREGILKRLEAFLGKRYNDTDLISVICKAVSFKFSDRYLDSLRLFEDLFPEEHFFFPTDEEMVVSEDFSDSLRGSKELQRITTKKLQSAYKNKDYDFIYSLSDKDIKVLVEDGSKVDRVKRALIIMKMLAKVGKTSKFSMIQERVEELPFNKTQEDEFNYYLAFDAYLHGHLKRANKYLKKCKKGDAANNNLKGMILQREGLFGKAADFYNEAISISENRNDDLNSAIYKGNLGTLYYNYLNRYKDALDLFDSTISLLKKRKNEIYLANIYYNKAALLVFFGALAESRKLLKESLKISKKFSLISLQGSINLLYAEIYKVEGDWVKQKKMANDAIKAFLSLNDRYHLYRCYINLAWGKLRRRSINNFRELLVKIRSLASELSSHENYEYPLLYASYLRSYYSGSSDHGLMVLSDASFDNSLSVKYENKKLMAYILKDLGRDEDSLDMFKEAERILGKIDKAIPEKYREHFRRYMEEVRLGDNIRNIRSSRRKKEVDMKTYDVTPSFFESIITTLRGVVEQVDPIGHQKVLLEDLKQISKAESVICCRYEQDEVIPILSAGHIDSKELVKKMMGRLKSVVAIKYSKEMIGKSEKSVISVPLSMGKNVTGFLLMIFEKDKTPKESVMKDLFQAYADLIEIISLITLNRVPALDDEVYSKSFKKKVQKNKFIFGDFSEVEKIKKNVDIASMSNIPVIIYGADGTGKQTLAREIHYSFKPECRVQSIDCRHADSMILYNEIFGTENRPGYLEKLDGGTLILHHIERLNWDVQSAIINYLQEGCYRPSGSTTYKASKTRIVGTAYEQLWEAVDAGFLNGQLVRLLGQVRIHIPSLGDRSDDIESLVKEYLKNKKTELILSTKAIRKLEVAAWRGNTAELFRVVDSLLMIENKITEKDIQEILKQKSVTSLEEVTASTTLDEMMRDIEKKIIENALEKCENNKSAVAQYLGVSRSNLYKKLKDHNLDHDVLSKEQIIAAMKACKGNKQRAAKQLNISRQSLYSKLAKYRIKL